MKSGYFIPRVSASPSLAKGLADFDPRHPLEMTAPVVSAAGVPSSNDAEEQYWRENHFAQPYGRDGEYEVYESAYRIGYEGFQRHQSRTSFAEIEAELRDQYDALHGDLPWIRARRATLAAWQRAYERHVNPNLYAE